MVVRAQQLPEDDLLTRYLDASLRHAAPRRPLRTNDLMLARYVRALERHGPMHSVTAGNDALRTCTSCGRRGLFEHASGGWSVCSACDALA